MVVYTTGWCPKQLEQGHMVRFEVALTGMDRGYDREFIIVDRTKLTKEGDQFKDATVFYHHPTNSMAEVI